MSRTHASDGELSVEMTFDRFRTRVLAGVQDPQLRRFAMVLLTIGAGLLPFLFSAANAEPAPLKEIPTDGADTLLLLIGSAQVMLMIPGLAFFYGGFTRSKNVLNTLMMSFFCLGLVGVLWVVIQYSLAFGTGFNSPFLGGLEHFMLNGIGGPLGDKPLAPGFAVSTTSFVLFQCMFAVISVALISGAWVERISFKAWFWFVLLWSLVGHAPMCKMVWGGGFLGPYGTVGSLDFAGGTVVHIASGAAAVVGVWIIGPRTGWPETKRPPHNVPFILLGAGLLFFGWFGFNGASMFAAKTAGLPTLVTAVAGCAGLLAWCIAEWFLDGKPTTVGAATGAVAGLVGITPAAGFVYLGPALIIGALASLGALTAVRIKAASRFDDSLDTFMVHGVGGTIGCLLTGVFAAPVLVPAEYFPRSAEILASGGNFAMFLAQLQGVIFSYLWIGVFTAIILLIIKATVGLRVTPEEEERGLDFVAHGEEAYDPMTN
jgi:Amt family ammonium transporter